MILGVLEELTKPTIINIIIISYMGASIGSFVVCWSWRYMRGISIVKVTHSFCDYCGKKLNLFEVMPIFGPIFNRGRCGKCGYIYPKTSLIVEIVFSIIFPIIYFGIGNVFFSFVTFIFISTCTSLIYESFS